MKNFKIEITETLARVVDVVAENENEALDKVRKMYRNGEIVLDADNYVDTEIQVFN